MIAEVAILLSEDDIEAKLPVKTPATVTEDADNL